MFPIAHAGHWIASLLYVVPVVAVVAGLTIVTLKEKRLERAEQLEAPSAEPTP